MKKNITVIKGDGIGPEIVTQAMRVLDKIAEKHGHEFCYTEILAGGCAIDAVGKPLPEESLQACLSADSVLLGAVGGPKWDAVDQAIRPEKALLGIRKAMGLYANMRPAKLFPQLSNASPLSDEVVARGIDMVVVRELIGGIYFGKKGVEEIDGEKSAYDVMRYSEHEIERIARTAFDTARKRNKKVTSIDKMNVLSSSRLWRDVVHRVAEEYPDVELVDMLVDNAAMQLVRDPSQFDVIVTENMFGDILSDEASMITGSIGMIPSSSLGETKNGMYEPIHGSAPDIAGKDLANPIGTILAAAMMLKYSFDMDKESEEIENAVASVLDAGYRTGDIMSPGKTQVGCQKMGDLIVAAL
ncbi:MAG: 3-isopropylmalate dehydrogenase [Acutalibacteraceae bacterium]|jgi:3-isopropylmalate dehydrogenase